MVQFDPNMYSVTEVQAYDDEFIVKLNYQADREITVNLRTSDGIALGKVFSVLFYFCLLYILNRLT